MIYDGVANLLGIWDNYPEVNEDIFNTRIERICSEIKDSESTVESLSKIAEENPSLIQDVSDDLEDLLRNDNTKIQKYCIKLLTKAELALDDYIVSDSGIKIISDMMIDDREEISILCSNLLQTIVAKGKKIDIKKVRVGTSSSINHIRLRCLQMIRYRTDTSEDYSILWRMEEKISENLKYSLNNLNAEKNIQIAEECLNLMRKLGQFDSNEINRMIPSLNKSVCSDNETISNLSLMVLSDLAKQNADAIEPALKEINKLISKVGHKKGERIIKVYREYLRNGGDKHKIEDVAEEIIGIYDSAEDLDSRKICLDTIRYLSYKNEIPAIEDNIGLLQKDINSDVSSYVLGVISNTASRSPRKVIDFLPAISNMLDSEESVTRGLAAWNLIIISAYYPKKVHKNSVKAQTLSRIAKRNNQIKYNEKISDAISKLSNIENKQEEAEKNMKYVSDAPDTDFEDYVGMKNMKDTVRDKIIDPMRNCELYEEFGVSVQRGFIFHGPAGTGKTHFARSIAGEFDISYIEVDASDLVSKWIGEGAKNINDMFDEAEELSPCLVFIDEIDAIASDRDKTRQTKSERQMVNQLLKCISRIDNKKKDITVIGATNRIDEVDDALLRTGRLGEAIEFGLPSPQTRLKIFNRYCKVDTSPIYDGWIMNETEGMKQSDIRKLANEASYQALKRYKEEGGKKKIYQRDLNGAVNSIIEQNT
jgi:ATP-dependent 26S proteasome regulatory subunit